MISFDHRSLTDRSPLHPAPTMVRQRAAGYDSDVARLDEARARSTLADMQERLARGPIVALGLTSSSTPEDARAAFLQLTKHYHPVRFGRMAADVQKLANEVFLSLRAAHDSVMKSLRRPTGPILPAPAPATPAAPASGPASTRGQALPFRVVRPPSHDTGERPLVPVASPGVAPGVPPVPASGPRPGAPRPAAPAAPGARAPSAVRPTGSAPPATARDEAAVLDLLQRQQWDQARTALHQLSARDPSSKRIRALEAYARGREAQLDRRLDDARVELQDALELDPDLQVAKTALKIGILPTRHGPRHRDRSRHHEFVRGGTGGRRADGHPQPGGRADHAVDGVVERRR
jgi:hypothetical protein